MFIGMEDQPFNSIEEKVRKLKKKTKLRPVKDVPKYPTYLKHLKKLNVLVPIEKAANNVGLICKIFPGNT